MHADGTLVADTYFPLALQAVLNVMSREARTAAQVSYLHCLPLSFMLLLLYVSVHMCVAGHVHAMAHMWSLEDNSGGDFSFCLVGSEN